MWDADLNFDLSVQVFVVIVSAVDIISSAGGSSSGRVSTFKSGKELDEKVEKLLPEVSKASGLL